MDEANDAASFTSVSDEFFGLTDLTIAGGCERTAGLYVFLAHLGNDAVDSCRVPQVVGTEPKRSGANSAPA